MSLDAPDATCRHTGSRRRERAVIFSGRTTGLRSSRAAVVSADDVSKHFKKVPRWSSSVTIQSARRLITATSAAKFARKQSMPCGRTAAREILILPEAGLKGNSHMMMMDRNNLQVADLIIGWIGEVTGRN